MQSGSRLLHGDILNPFAQPTTNLESIEGLCMAPRLESLEGKVVYLVDTGFHGARDFMEEAEGFNTKEDLCKWLADEVRPVKGPLMVPEMINIVVVGGEWNPFWITTDFFHTQTVPIDKWIPKTGIRHDERPLRMPKAVKCKDGSCGIH